MTAIGMLACDAGILLMFYGERQVIETSQSTLCMLPGENHRTPVLYQQKLRKVP